MIATPWLVLRLTNDPLVLALVGIPRAVFILLGGAIVDRFSSRLIMIASWQRILAASQSIYPLGVVFNLSEIRPQASSLVL